MTTNNQNGSAIITVIVFITIVMLFISGLLLYKKYQSKQIIRFGDEIQAYYNAKSALTFALKNIKPFLVDKDYSQNTFQYNLFSKDSTTVSIEPFGYYLRCISTSKIHNISKTRTFLIGTKQNELSKYAMIIGNTRNPVIVTGNTMIRGDVAVGLQGVKPGVIKGRRYKGQRVVYGNVYKDVKSYLPKINFELLQVQRQQLASIYPKSEFFISNENPNRIYLQNSIYNFSQQKLSELQKTGVTTIIGPGILKIDSDIQINNFNLYNQITIYSTKSVHLSNNINSDNILVFANKIIMNGPSKLKGQFFAQNSFNISNGTKLEYPSIVGLVSKKVWNAENEFQIGPDVEIEGAIFLANDIAEEIGRKRHKLLFEKSTRVKGFTYSDNYTELQGSVYGTVMTNTFHFYLSPTIYINWIKDAEINRSALDREFYYPLAFDLDNELIAVREL